MRLQKAEDIVITKITAIPIPKAESILVETPR